VGHWADVDGYKNIVPTGVRTPVGTPVLILQTHSLNFYASIGFGVHLFPI
jgi:hypothetical protein